MTETTPAQARGQCYCGAVHITVDLPVAWVAHCHCSMCRRYHGAPVVTWFGVHHGRYQYNDDDVVWFQSSESAERGRCRHCGSPLLFRSQRWPDELHIVLAAMTESIERQPELHVYYADRVTWLPLTPHEPCYRTVPSQDEAPMPSAPVSD